MQNLKLLKDFVGVKEDVKSIVLEVKDRRIIKKLLEIAPKKHYIVYFDGGFVEEVYDDYEFKDDEEMFYYYNSNSYLVFRDITDFEVRIKYSTLEKVKKVTTFEHICSVTSQAVEYTKKHPFLSDYKLY